MNFYFNNERTELEKLFEKALRKEIMLSETRRVTLLTIIAAIPVVFFSLLIIFANQYFSTILFDHTPVYWIIGILTVFSLRELLIVFALKRRIEKDQEYGDRVRFINSFVEISFPSLVIFIVSFYWKTPDILSTPAVIFYLVIIILSILSLDAKLSVFTGVVAFVEYILIVVFLFESLEIPETGRLADMPYMYFAKGLFILIGGFAAGFIARQLRERIFNSFLVISERNRAVNLFGQQVSKQVVDELLSKKSELRSKKHFVSIMFLDIRRFTPFVENMEPEEIIEFQNKIFGFMIEIINDNGGIVNQLLGDGFMATFGAPLKGENDCRSALEASLEILRVLESKVNDKELPDIKIGIGIHAGEVVAGNVGTDSRKQYSITGNPVIISSRLEQLNKVYGTHLLVSEEVIKRAGDVSRAFIPLGAVTVKGIEKPISIYKPQ